MCQKQEVVRDRIIHVIILCMIYSEALWEILHAPHTSVMTTKISCILKTVMSRTIVSLTLPDRKFWNYIYMCICGPYKILKLIILLNLVLHIKHSKKKKGLGLLISIY